MKKIIYIGRKRQIVKSYQVTDTCNEINTKYVHSIWFKIHENDIEKMVCRVWQMNKNGLFI